MLCIAKKAGRKLSCRLFYSGSTCPVTKDLAGQGAVPA